MRTSLLVGLIVTLCVLVSVGSSTADSTVNYPDTSVSDAFYLGGGVLAFVFFDNAGDGDIFIHVVTGFGDLTPASLNQFTAYAFWLDFEGNTNQGFQQFGIYTCTSTGGQFCNVSGVRRGTFLF